MECLGGVGYFQRNWFGGMALLGGADGILWNRERA